MKSLTVSASNFLACAMGSPRTQNACGMPGYISSRVGTPASLQTCSKTNVQSRMMSHPHAWKYVLGIIDGSGIATGKARWLPWSGL